MTRRALGLVVLVIVGVSAAAADPLEVSEQPSLADLFWLSGCWESDRGERLLEEQWLRPRGGMMLGMSRTVAGDTVVGFEYMHIREDGEHLVFTARPSGQQEASFRSIFVTPSKVVFENPTHDFPQRIIYELGEDGSLLGRIEGMRAGEMRGIDFPMRRFTCAESDDR